MKRKIVVVTGLPGSGKSEVYDYLLSSGIPCFKTGDIIRQEVLRRGLPLNPVNAEMIARKIREEEGMDIAARRTGEKMKGIEGIICVEGPRDMTEIRYLATLGNVHLIIINASIETRFERIKTRTGGRMEPKSRDPNNFAEFKWRNDMERERGMDDVLSTNIFPRHAIQNTSTKEKLYLVVDRILSKLKYSG